MPITLPNGSCYKLCLLDTNALSEIVKNPTIEGRGYVERFPPSEYVPCFTPYNLIELRRDTHVFARFVDFFRVYPSFLTNPFQFILDSEANVNGRTSVNEIVLYAFSSLGDSHDFTALIDRLFSDPVINRLEDDWRTRDEGTLDKWMRNKSNFEPINSTPNSVDAKQFVETAAVDTLCHLHPDLAEKCIENNTLKILHSLPSLLIMLYSQYYRIFDDNWSPSDQEVTDVCISACSPYVDAVVTEKFQAEIYRKVSKQIPGMELEIAKLRDIRYAA